MSLDVYVGTLTRYYSGQWETAVERALRATGHAAPAAPPAPRPGATTDPDEIEAIILAWRSWLSDELGEHLPAPLDWPEGMDPPYFSDRPDSDGLAGLLLLAAYAEHPELPRPEGYSPRWQHDPAFLASCEAGAGSRYIPVLTSQMWLPGDFRFVLTASDPGGAEIAIASTGELLRLLRELNELHWRGGQEELEAWRRPGLAIGSPFEVQARFGLAAFLLLAEEAAAHGLPMKLDHGSD